MLGVERRRRVARPVAGAERDVAVDPRRASVERGEEPGRHDHVPGAGRVVEAVVVVVRSREQVIRILRIHGDRNLVVGIPILAVRPGIVAAHVDRDRRISGALAAVRGDLHLREASRLGQPARDARVAGDHAGPELVERVQLAAVLLVDGAGGAGHRDDDHHGHDSRETKSSHPFPLSPSRTKGEYAASAKRATSPL